jgi:hypothetical protein
MEDKVVDVYMATMPRQLHVVHTVKSILDNPETLTITITANKYTDFEFEEMCNRIAGLNSLYNIPIQIHRGDNAKESNEKLKYIGEGYGKYISFVDDDLLLAPNHFHYLIEGCEKHNAYVSLHGVILHPLPIKSYYRDRDVYRGLGTVIFDQEVDIASNCGSLFKRDFFTDTYLTKLYELAPAVSMDDIIMATACKLNNIKRYVLSHSEGFMQHKTQYKEDDYVFDKYKFNDSVQTNYINKYWSVFK